MKVQTIIGKTTLAEWDQYVESLKTDANYSKITEEINEEYSKRKALE